MTASKKNCGILVLAEPDPRSGSGMIARASIELIGKARELADRLDTATAALLSGWGIAPGARDLIACGADLVLLADDERLKEPDADVITTTLCSVILEYAPDIVLGSSTTFGQEVLARAAARLSTGLAAHCCDLEVDADGLLIQRIPAFGGTADIVCLKMRPQMSTVAPGIFAEPTRDYTREGDMVTIELNPIYERCERQGGRNYRVVGTTLKERSGIILEEAERVVAGGMGIGSKDGWRLVEELASSLDAAVGATRPPVDEGWADPDIMIGQSGKSIRPKLYIGIGISGEQQHTVGIRDAGVVVAINNDPKAPLLKMADYGIVGDYEVILPLLIKAVSDIRKAAG